MTPRIDWEPVFYKREVHDVPQRARGRYRIPRG